MKTETQTLRFVHSFSEGLACEFKIPDQCPQGGQFLNPTIAWRGTSKHRYFDTYRTWICFVLQTLADRWEERIICALQANSKIEIWRFNPGRVPRLEHAFFRSRGGELK
jgi:hypothetical protein